MFHYRQGEWPFKSFNWRKNHDLIRQKNEDFYFFFTFFLFVNKDKMFKLNVQNDGIHVP